MKKLIAIAVIAFVVSSVSFAQTNYSNYSGDFQIPQVGWQGANGNEFRNRLYIGMSQWNLWSVNDWFSAGFYEKIDIGAGPYGGAFTLVTGGAAGFRVKDIVKFHVGSGFPVGLDVQDNDQDGTIDKIGIIGFAVDTQAKFLPKSIVSPLVGFQLRFMGTTSTALYAGASINWGRR